MCRWAGGVGVGSVVHLMLSFSSLGSFLAVVGMSTGTGRLTSTTPAMAAGRWRVECPTHAVSER